MRSFPKNIVRTNRDRFQRGFARIKKLRDQWVELVNRAEPLLSAVADETKDQNMFEHIYFINSEITPDLEKKLPMLQLFFGQHSLGFNEISTEKLVVERGCSLTICQLVTGQVVCTLYPFHSALMSRKEKYVISRIFSSPAKMTERHVNAQIKNLFSYAQVSSVFGAPTMLDCIRVFWLKAEHWWLHFRLGPAAINLLDKLTGVALDKSISE